MPRNAAALSLPVEPGHGLQRLGIGRQSMFLPVVDHLDAMLGGPQRAIGIADRLRDLGVEPSGIGQRVQRIEGRRGAQRRLPAAMDQLLDLGEEFRLADSASAALQVIAGAERPGPAHNGRGFGAMISRISWIAPKSSARRQMKGRISSQKAIGPVRISPAAARARMKAARSHGRAELS